MDNERQTSSTLKLESILTYVFLLVIISGCRSGLDMSKLRGADKSRVELAKEEEKKGMFSRVGDKFSSIGQASFLKSADDTSMEPLPNSAGYKELEEAKSLSKAGEDGKAESKFKKIIKNKDYVNTSIVEEAIFLRAESFYNRKKYASAQDAYTELMKTYPSTRYMRKSTQRLFDLSRHWLGFSEVVTSGDIKQINFADVKSTETVQFTEPSPKGLTRTIPILPNLFDRSRPVFDTEGRAIEALKTIWMNDPTGPLADDALMLTASYHLRNNDYELADHVLTIIREEYPKSPHLENAFQIGSHVKMMSYQGPEYEGKSLDDSKKLMESTLRIFPGAKNRERTLDDIRKIEHAHAEAQWKWVEYYQKKERPQSVAIYCNVILDEYPHSVFATKAQKILNDLDSNQLASKSSKKKRSRLSFLRRKKPSKKEDVPNFEDDVKTLKKAESPARLKRLLPRFTRRKNDDDKEISKPAEISDDEIPEYDEPQFIDDDSGLSDDENEITLDDEPAPSRMELEPGEDSDFINLEDDVPEFDE